MLLEFAVEISAHVGYRVWDMCDVDRHCRMCLEMGSSQRE